MNRHLSLCTSKNKYSVDPYKLSQAQQEQLQPLYEQLKDSNITSISYLQIVRCNLPIPRGLKPQEEQAFHIAQGLLEQNPYRLNKVISILRFQNLQNLFIYKCQSLLSLQFFAYIYSPILQEIHINTCQLVASLKPLKKIVSDNLKTIKIQYLSLTCMEQLQRVHFQKNQDMAPQVQLTSLEDNSFSLMAQNINLLAKFQFEEYPRSINKLKRIIYHVNQMEQDYSNRLFNQFGSQNYKKTKSLEFSQISKFQKLKSRFR